MSNKVLSILLALILVLSLMPLSVFTASAASGTCGNNLTWNFNEETYTLTISGTGAMNNYDYANCPWKDYRKAIQTVIVETGVTSVGEYAFYNCSNLSDIKCPLCKQNINPNTFQQHIKLELLDPKWKEIQKEISKRQDTSALANTSEVLTYLSSFSKSRPDLFGNITDIHNFEQNKATDSSSLPNQPIWNGYNPYMSRTTANITMFKQQNKKHLEESKKAALANNASTSKNN
jgi:hypothetical protein